MIWLLELLFPCRHRRTTFPQTPARRGIKRSAVPGRQGTYVVCLDCGREFDYDWQEMRIGQPITVHIGAAPWPKWSKV
jgi:hypothetical protein